LTLGRPILNECESDHFKSYLVEEHKAYHWIMDAQYLVCPGSGPADRSIAADVFLREEPDEEEEDGEEHDPDEEDDDGDEGYSE
jgi:hypothetical protein